MAHYQDFKTNIAVEVLGQHLVLPLWQLVEGLDRSLNHEDIPVALDFISCLDAYQEDAEFTENLAKRSTDTYTDWIVEAGIQEDDPDWYQEVIDYYKSIVEKLEGK